MCAEWRDSFSAFYEHLGAKPSPAHTVDRIDNALGYQPGNCRWADKIEQSENRAVTRYITLDGNTKSLSAWCRELGLSRHTVWRRLRGGASPEESLRACATPTQVLAGGRMRSIPECAEILGVNRESAYRLHRAGLLVSRVDSHHP